MTILALTYTANLATTLKQALKLRNMVVLAEYKNIKKLCSFEKEQSRIQLKVNVRQKKVAYCQRPDISKRSRWWYIEAFIKLPVKSKYKLKLFELKVFKNTL